MLDTHLHVYTAGKTPGTSVIMNTVVNKTKKSNKIDISCTLIVNNDQMKWCLHQC